MLSNRPFMTATSVFAAYMLANTVLSFALPLLAFDISQSGAGLALIKGAGFIPNVLFAIVIGVINDRLRKAFGFQLYTGLLTLSCAALWGLLVSDQVSIPALVVLMIVLNGVGYALGNLQMTLIRLVVDPEKLSEATSFQSAVNATITTVGPAIGGFTLLWLGYTGLVMAVTLLFALTFLATFTINPAETLPPRQPFWPSLVEGWQVFRANRELMMMTVVIVLTNAAEGAFGVGLILKIKTDLLASDAALGIVLAAAGGGSVIAASFAPKIRRKLGYRCAFFWPIWMLGAVYVAIAFAPTLPLLFILSFFEGALSLFFAIGVWTYRQETTQAMHMGRVAGITGAIFKVGMPPVIILAGLLSDVQAITSVFLMAVGINAVAGLFLATIGGWGWPGPAKTK